MDQPLTNQKSKKTRFLSILFRITVAISALAFVFRNQDWTELRGLLAQVHWQHFLLALVVYCACQGGIALRWRILLKAQGIYSVSPGSAVRLHYLGLFYNNIMPSSIGGDLLKAWYATKHTEKRVEAFLSVFVDRAIGLSGMLLMALFAYVFLMEPGTLIDNSDEKAGFVQSLSGHGRILGWLGVGIIVALAVLLIFPPVRQRLVLGGAWVVEHLSSVIHKTSKALVLYCKRPIALVNAIVLTILMQSATILGFWFLGKDLQIHCALRFYFIVFPVSWIVGALPISIGGVGILEGGIRVLFTHLAGIRVEPAVALAICQRFIWMLASIPGGIIHLLGAHLPKSFSFDLEQDAG
jgi:uncharacterized protein (TIRG00374 family)